MVNLNLCTIDSYNVFVEFVSGWRYIVNVDESDFKHTIEEAESCARVNHMDLITEIDMNDFSDGVIYKNYKIDGRTFAYIQYRSIEDFDI